MNTTTRDGRALHYDDHGRGAPTVVLEAGMGACRLWWDAVVPLVAARTRTIAYDRAGLGRSPVDPRPRTLDRLAGDLVDLLTEVGDGPCVVAAHSWGGPIVRLAAAQAPELVAGIVLVDATDEGCDLYFGRGAAVQTRASAAALPAFARIGALRLATRTVGRSLSADAAARLRVEEGSVAHARAFRAELAPSIDELRELVERPPSPPEVPVTLISGTRASRIGRRRRDALVDAHRARAAALPHGRHVEADRSAHLVLLTEPALVADEILRIVDVARGS